MAGPLPSSTSSTSSSPHSNETTPLLHAAAPTSPHTHGSVPKDIIPSPPPPPPPSRAAFLRTALPLLAILTMLEIASACCASGLVALVEGSLCRRAFPDGQVPTTTTTTTTTPYGDPRCKHPAIQADLAWIIGMENTVSVIPALFVSVAYGIVADRYGANRVMGLIWVGQFLSEGGHLLICINPQLFNVRWIYASSLMTFIGGGPTVYAALSYLVGASLVSEKNRTTMFFYMQAYSNIIAFLAGPIAYAVMKASGPVYTHGLGVLVIGLMTIPGFALPRRLSNMPMPMPMPSTSSSTTVVSSSNTNAVTRRPLTAIARETASTFRLVVRHSPQLSLLLAGVVFATLGSYETMFRLQYAAQRFRWSWAQTSLLASVTSAANLATLLVLLPALARLLLHLLKTADTTDTTNTTDMALTKDLWLARSSAAILVLGSFATALAPSPLLFVAAVALYECNKGCMPSMASLVVSLASRTHHHHQTHHHYQPPPVTAMYACVSTMTAIGQILAGPILASTFRLGLNWGRAWYGLPFLAAGMMQLCTFCILACVKK